MQTIFTALVTSTSNKISNWEQAVYLHPSLWIFGLFSFLLIWSFISKKHNFILWTSFFLQTIYLKTWIIRTTSHKMNWNELWQKFSPPPFIQCCRIHKLHQNQAANKSLTHNIFLREEKLSLNRVILRFLRENLNNLCFIELSQNFCDCFSWVCKSKPHKKNEFYHNVVWSFSSK